MYLRKQGAKEHIWHSSTHSTAPFCVKEEIKI